MNRLPNEILDAIFAWLAENPLLQLSLVSCSMRALVEPFIYRNLSMTLVSPFNKGRKPFTRVMYLWNRLVEKLSRNDAAASNVSSLSINIKTIRAHRVFEEQSRLLTLLPCLDSVNLGPPPANLDLTYCTMLSHSRVDFRHYSKFSRPHLSKTKVIGILRRSVTQCARELLHSL